MRGVALRHGTGSFLQARGYGREGGGGRERGGCSADPATSPPVKQKGEARLSTQLRVAASSLKAACMANNKLEGPEPNADRAQLAFSSLALCRRQPLSYRLHG